MIFSIIFGLLKYHNVKVLLYNFSKKAMISENNQYNFRRINKSNNNNRLNYNNNYILLNQQIAENKSSDVILLDYQYK
jgi:hypothetical protein